ncbi:Radical SAM domain protein [Spirochaeta thermophila DSM 6578]|uniref:Radical SAM domain protein n=1 Tax=Winmispira thermophila (strain ATCC 700085 / DSM 6578 / Z-1203) TaxID=869211 RepID=G0GEE4_WINT7|nr:radical SAM/SPASM domain-containing protein [Spirochaeta thermophila]AEJ62281.1 Radical SAM domain protein [Spirochaeta thermophila DSM 6578]
MKRMGRGLGTQVPSLLLSTSVGRKWLLRRVEKVIEDSFRTSVDPPYVREVKKAFLLSLLRQGLKQMDRGRFSPRFAVRAVSLFMKEIFFNRDYLRVLEEFRERYGFHPPAFLTLSPTQKCNLNCVGCYAASHAATAASLPYAIARRIVREMHDLMGARFIVISGGEPLLWRDGGKGILDLAEEFPDTLFLMYTNGLLIDEKVAERMVKLGNLTPAISVEGFKEHTDARRGEGIFDRILERMSVLRSWGVPFGVSITATRENIDLLLDERFYDFWFEEQGATYMWMFHLMPIGRAKDTMDLMLTPEERRDLLLVVERMLLEKSYFVGDFWNAGAASEGCIAYGRGGGYFYIDWHGNIMPCVFIPYYVHNVHDLYREGKTLVDALMSGFFEAGRTWQEEYKLQDGNFFMPCSIRDHHPTFRSRILPDEAKPEDQHAAEALADLEYYETLCAFHTRLKELVDPLWKERVEGGGPVTSGERG